MNNTKCIACGNDIEPERLAAVDTDLCIACAKQANIPRKKGIMVFDPNATLDLEIVNERTFDMYTYTRPGTTGVSTETDTDKLSA